MGMIQSVICSATFCVERVLTWTCCAFLLMLLMFSIIMLMVYGISVGYHYAQKELASFALSSRTTTEKSNLRAGPEDTSVVRLLAVNRSEMEDVERSLLDLYETRKPDENIYLDTSGTPIVYLETERSQMDPELLPHERQLARRLISRFRRSRTNTSIATTTPFLRPLRNTTSTLAFITS